MNMFKKILFCALMLGCATHDLAAARKRTRPVGSVARQPKGRGSWALRKTSGVVALATVPVLGKAAYAAASTNSLGLVYRVAPVLLAVGVFAHAWDWFTKDAATPQGRMRKFVKFGLTVSAAVVSLVALAAYISSDFAFHFEQGKREQLFLLGSLLAHAGINIKDLALRALCWTRIYCPPAPAPAPGWGARFCALVLGY